MLQASSRRSKPLTEVEGIGEKTAGKLAEAGITTVGEVLDKSAEELAEIPGLGEKSAEKILEAARAFDARPEPEESDEEAGDEGENISETAEETTVGE